MEVVFSFEIGSTVTAVACDADVVVCGVSSRTSAELVFPARRLAAPDRITTIALCRDDDEILVAAFGARSGGWVVVESEVQILAAFKEDDDEPEGATFDASGQLIAMGVGRDVEVATRDVEVATRDVEVATRAESSVRLEGHRGRVAALAFLAEPPNLLASASEDRTFRVWDFAARACVYESFVVSAPLVGIATTEARLAVAANNGRVWVHEWLDTTCRELCAVDTRALPLAACFRHSGKRLVVATVSAVCDVDVVASETTTLVAPQCAASAAALFRGGDSAVFASAFEPKVVLFRRLYHPVYSPPAGHQSLSFFAAPGDHPAKTSPLLVDDPKKHPATRRELLAWDSWNVSNNNNNNNNKNQKELPVLFHSRIKSSGYGAKTTSKQKQQQQQTTTTTRSKRPTKQHRNNRLYPVDCGVLEAHQPQHDLGVGAPATSVACAGDARLLAVATTSGPTLLYRLPVSVHRAAGPTALGRTARHVVFSHDCRMLLTTSACGAVDIWPANTEAKSHDAPKLSVVFPKAAESAAARFFYLDRFVLAAGANATLEMHTYTTSSEQLPSKNVATTAAKPSCASPRRRRPAHSFGHGPAQHITAIGCINSALSSLIVTAASNRSVHILDAAAARTARVIDDAHARPVHTVALPVPTTATNQIPQQSYELFATAATDGVVATWDVRSQKCVARFSAHVNRREPVGVTFSPCMRYIAVGSEDKTACLYDLRAGTEAARHKRIHADVVSCVAFNPVYPQFITGSYDGSLRFFTCHSSTAEDLGAKMHISEKLPVMIKEVKLPFAAETHELIVLVRTKIGHDGLLENEHRAWRANLILLLDVRSLDAPGSAPKVVKRMLVPTRYDRKFPSAVVGGPRVARESKSSGDIWVGLEGLASCCPNVPEEEEEDDKPSAKKRRTCRYGGFAAVEEVKNEVRASPAFAKALGRNCCSIAYARKHMKVHAEEFGYDCPTPNAYAPWHVNPDAYDAATPERGGTLFDCVKSPPMCGIDALDNCFVVQDASPFVMYADETRNKSIQIPVPFPAIVSEADRLAGPGCVTASDGDVWCTLLGVDAALLRFHREASIIDEQSVGHDLLRPRGTVVGRDAPLTDSSAPDGLFLLEFDADWKVIRARRVVPLPTQNSAIHRVEVVHADSPESCSAVITELDSSKLFQIKLENIVDFETLEEVVENITRSTAAAADDQEKKISYRRCSYIQLKDPKGMGA
ncbi:hypothetical protein CTAYLR_004228 [Chrysophaeum taylorii]|uniref:Uncharacterized protein n=1 Tax=Chrysophaeum taylorii TaxID=2483200 RepID=A0AAD7UEU4_9STRA|nr:hypothetical protein CTAYLR_004228 [Chrysophaeum taylorii]